MTAKGQLAILLFCFGSHVCKVKGLLNSKINAPPT